MGTVSHQGRIPFCLVGEMGLLSSDLAADRDEANAALGYQGQMAAAIWELKRIEGCPSIDSDAKSEAPKGSLALQNNCFKR